MKPRVASAGFTLIEMMLVTGIISLLAAIALPNLKRARLAGNESSAIASMRTIQSSQQTFSASCGYGMFAVSLTALAQPVGTSAGFLPPDLSVPAPVVKSGYEFDVTTASLASGTSCNGSGLAFGYHATADPRPGQGRRFFALNTTGTIYQSTATMFGVVQDEGAPPAPAIPLTQY